MKLFFFLSAFFFPVILFSQHRISIKFSDINPIQGKIYVGLYNSDGDFMKTDKFFRQCITPVNGENVECTLDDIPEGTYAISVFHDENGNGKLDTGTFGIPKEGYGFSNNARGMFGPPSFTESSFFVKGNVVQNIKL